jgi:pimeloyl-ACP methyl ester carboxylesterase
MAALLILIFMCWTEDGAWLEGRLSGSCTGATANLMMGYRIEPLLKDGPLRGVWLTFPAVAVLLAMGLAPARSETPTPRVVLAGGSSWAAVVPLLEAAGLRVTGADLPPAALDAGAMEAKRVLALQDGPVVLVAQGWAGAVASEIGSDPKVSALVFVAAQAPEVGEDFAELAVRYPLKIAVARRGGAPMVGKTTVAAWRDKPTFYAVSEQDPTLSPALQRFYAARMKAQTIVLDDVAQHPREVAGLILAAAGMKPAACGSAKDDGKGACAAPALPRSVAEGCKCTKGSLEELTAP